MTLAASQTTTSARSRGNGWPKNAERIFSRPVFSDIRITLTNNNESCNQAGWKIPTETP
jgi:hypothetical protein